MDRLWCLGELDALDFSSNLLAVASIKYTILLAASTTKTG